MPGDPPPRCTTCNKKHYGACRQNATSYPPSQTPLQDLGLSINLPTADAAAAFARNVFFTAGSTVIMTTAPAITSNPIGNNKPMGINKPKRERSEAWKARKAKSKAIYIAKFKRWAEEKREKMKKEGNEGSEGSEGAQKEFGSQVLGSEPAGDDKSGEHVEPQKPNAAEEEEDGGVRL